MTMSEAEFRKKFYVRFFVLSLFSLFVLQSSWGKTINALPARPNIIVIMTNDQTVESLRVMKNVRRFLVREGVTFENSFVTLPVCCPSRATFLTGQYAHNHGVLSNIAPTGGYSKLNHSNTLAVWLRRAKYRNIHVGIYLNQYGRSNPTEIPKGWTEWYTRTSGHYYRFKLNENGTIVKYKGEENYHTDVIARRAVDVIHRMADDSSPFFLWFTTFAPHHGRPLEPDDPPNFGTPAVAVRHRDAFAFERLPLTPSFNEEDVSDKPLRVRGLPLMTQEQITAIQENYQQRLESLLAVDEAVREIVKALKQEGILDNTWIFFTSDNGFFQGEHRIPQGKGLFYEPSIRVPLVVRGPGVPKGVRLTQNVANIDLAPTIVAITGAVPRRVMDGRSLLPLFRDPGLQFSRDILIESNTRNGANFTAIRTSTHLYAEYGNGEKELYDLVADPEELESRHEAPAYETVRQTLAGRLAVLRNCRGQSCGAD